MIVGKGLGYDFTISFLLVMQTDSHLASSHEPLIFAYAQKPLSLFANIQELMVFLATVLKLVLQLAAF
jgi:hypothetical protein